MFFYVNFSEVFLENLLSSHLKTFQKTGGQVMYELPFHCIQSNTEINLEFTA